MFEHGAFESSGGRNSTKKGEEKVESGASTVSESRIDGQSEQRRHRSLTTIKDFETFWSRSRVTKPWEMKRR
ncbi:hypothetical protein V6N12_017105 [Hibiscus sabdariffa]|uniref:Uncharacterized protein n=1 Tax=Hibiscus sabdariffa TaxID=183260 RepID=A0ABR2BBV0_9ROSI